MKLDRCCGIVIKKGSEVLLGNRGDGQGWGLAGGKLEEGESFYEAALRELMEEFSLVALSMMELGRVQEYAEVKGNRMLVEPLIYLCNEYEGIPQADGCEILEIKWFNYQEAISILHMFPPSKQALIEYKDMIFVD